MNYTPMGDYKLAWIFRHREMPVDDISLQHIKPLSQDSAQQFWRTHLSKEATHASHFSGDDWASQNGVWKDKGVWQSIWESEDNGLPELMADHCQWDSNTQVFFCYDSSHVIQTTWHIMKQYWKNFLFYDDAVFLLAKKRQQVIKFDSDGTFQTGLKPK